MERLEFLTYEDFACEIADKFDAVSAVDDCNDVAVIAKYAEIKEIFKELVCIGYDICNVELEFPDMDEYNDEYVLALSVSGIWIEKFKREHGYLDDISTITYILDNCSSKAISHCLGKKVYEVCVGSDDENDYEINGVHTTKEVFDRYVNTYVNPKKDEEKKELSSSDTESSVTYHVNGEQVDKKTYEKAIADIEDAYLDNIRDMLLGYCEVMDEVNEWRSRFLRW